MEFLKSPDYYLLINSSKLIISFNNNVSMVWEELYQEKLICNQPLDQFIPKELLSDFPALLSLCLKSEHLTFERILSFPNGKSLHLKLTFNPICVGDRVSYILISIQNNYRNRALLRQKQRALSRYAFLTSHKLRAPLSNILSLSQSVNEMNSPDYDPRVIKKLLGDISQQAESLDSIIYTLNDLITKDNTTKREERELSKKKINDIMLIDDDPIVNIIHQKMLATHWESITVKSFTEALSALEAMRENQPDLILLDINMPVMNGWQFLQELEGRKINTDVIMVSSSIDPEEKRRAFTFKNVKFFLNKPVTPDLLRSVLVDKA